VAVAEPSVAPDFSSAVCTPSTLGDRLFTKEVCVCPPSSGLFGPAFKSFAEAVVVINLTGFRPENTAVLN